MEWVEDTFDQRDLWLWPPGSGGYAVCYYSRTLHIRHESNCVQLWDNREEWGGAHYEFTDLEAAKMFGLSLILGEEDAVGG